MKPLLSIGDLIDQTWRLYRTQFQDFMRLSGWLGIIIVLHLVSLLLYPTASSLNYHSILSGTETTGVVLYMLTSFVAEPLLGLWIFITIAKAASSWTHSQSVSLRAVRSEAKGLIIPTLLVSLLIGLILIAIQIATLGPWALLAFIGAVNGSAALSILATVLLVVGLFLNIFFTGKFTVYYLMSSLSVILDHSRGKAALTASRSLISGRFWAVLLRSLVPKIIFAVFALLITNLFILFIEFIVAGSNELNIDLGLRINTLAENLIPIVVAILFNPLLITSDVLLFQNLKDTRS